MSRLKRVFIVASVFLLAFLCGCDLKQHQWGSFTDEEKQYSYDGAYYSIQSVEFDDQESARMVFVRVYKTIDDELICELEPCRYRDYMGMVWERDRFAFWIQSGDIGLGCFELVGGEWVEHWNLKKPDYIVSVFDDLLEYGSFSPESEQYSFDDTYYSIQTIEDDKVCIRLYTSNDDELICELQPCSSIDYWGMKWEVDRYAFWIQSGERGVFCIELVDGEWVENGDCQRPGYIVPKYDLHE